MGHLQPASLLLPLLLSAVLIILIRPKAVEARQVARNASNLFGEKQIAGCNLFRGKWVPDVSMSLYTSCPFIDTEFDCQGRPDKQFLKYSWQPDSCSLPKFNGLELLTRWRGKKIMFVGDSLSLNMFESLACMIHASVPTAKYSFSRRDSLSSVFFTEYEVTVQLYRTPYLVDIKRESVGRVLELDSISAGALWKDTDVLIFNSWHWWTHTGNSQPWDYLREGTKLYKDMDRLVAFYKGLNTWARWVDLNINPAKTKVFFQGISPTHYKGKEWNRPSKSCNGEMEPLTGSSYPGGDPPEVGVVNRVLSSIKNPVYLLDITTLSQLRKDAHPAGEHGGNDCSHWCLPGLPDTWNQLLYAAL